jgi:hypothetical protein
MQNKIIIVIGPKGSGKTYTVCEAIAKIDRVVIFDMVHEAGYAEVVLNQDGRTKSQNAILIGEPRAFANAISKDKEKFKVIYRPINIEPEDNGLVTTDEFGPVCRLCFLRGDLYLVVDEAHLLCNSRNCPKELMVANLLGRHRRMSLILVAQSFTGIHPAIRKNTDEFLFWRIIEPSDLDGIKDRCGKDVAERVQNLRPLERDAETDKLIRPGQMLRWDKLRGVVEVTNVERGDEKSDEIADRRPETRDNS